jgi:hypothetical protein
MTRRILASASIVLALTACGGNAEKKKENAANAAVAAHWRTGLRHWGVTMTKAINGLSVIFSRPSDVLGIQSGDKVIAARLSTFESTLFACTQTVTGLGAAPTALLTARAEALSACTQLQKGAALIRDGVRQLQGGQGVDLLNRSSEPLGAGQDQVRRAQLDLAQTG